MSIPLILTICCLLNFKGSISNGLKLGRLKFLISKFPKTNIKSNLLIIIS